MKKYVVIALLCAVTALWHGADACGAGQATVVLLPFDVAATEDLNALQSSLSVLLPSRITVPGKILVLDGYAVKQEPAQKPKSLSSQEKLAVAKKLGADYCLAGTITKIGTSISIDAQLIPVKTGGQPTPFFMQSPGFDDIIPELNMFAKKIREKIFADRSPPVEQTGLQRERVAAQRTGAAYESPQDTADTQADMDEEEPLPEPPPPVRRKLKRSTPAQLKKPVFKKPAAPFEAAPYFSYDIASKPLSMFCAGDFNGDGKKELIVAGQDEIRIYQVGDRTLTQCGTVKLTMDEHIVHIDAADMNGNGTDEIYVSSYENHYANSFVVEFTGGDYKRITKAQKWFFRIYTPADEEAKKLIGQEAYLANPFSGTLYRFEWRDGQLLSREEFLMPGSYGLYGFAEGDIDNDASKEYLVFVKQFLSSGYKLTLYSITGKVLWQDKSKLGGTPNFFMKFLYGDEMQEQEFVPMRIICDYFSAADYLPTVIVAKNSRKGDKLIDKLLNYNQGEVQGLAWNGADFETIWSSGQFNDYVTDYIVDDIDNDTKKELCILSVSGEDTLGKSVNRVTVFRQASQ